MKVQLAGCRFYERTGAGIEKSKGMVKKAMEGGCSVSSFDVSSLVGAIREGISGASGNGGDIVIPVYLGGTMRKM